MKPTILPVNSKVYFHYCGGTYVGQIEKVCQTTYRCKSLKDGSIAYLSFKQVKEFTKAHEESSYGRYILGKITSAEHTINVNNTYNDDNNPWRN